MNILYCGNDGIIDGLIISILSLLKTTKRVLHIYVFTFKYKGFNPMREDYMGYLDNLVKEKNKDSFVKLMDISTLVYDCMPEANLSTRFTPYCMLRLYADLLDLPEKILYLDNDTVFLKCPDELYDIDISNVEIAGVLDYYGSRFFRKKIKVKDYLNSGVLLMNLAKIKENNSFYKCRRRLKYKKTFLPDQSAINMYCKHKLILNRKYNEQKEIKCDTVIRHYCSTFRFKPTFKVLTVKPWDIDRLHSIFNDHEFDDILEEYKKIKGEIK